jgi:hypothetical protein
MKNKSLLPAIGFVLLLIAANCSSCKSCKKQEPAPTVNADTTSFTPSPHTIDLPHADTTLIPVLSKVLDEAFTASAKKDLKQFGSMVVYRGPDSLKFGMDVFNAKNNYDRNVLRLTSEVFNKWNTDIDSKDYSRVFEMPLPDGRNMPVMEVIFVSKKSVDRKFFGFLQIKEEWKIADVTSSL